MKKLESISIIVPAYNEEKTLSAILDKVRRVDLGTIKKEIIIVNDGSSDSTEKIASKYCKEHTRDNTSFKIITNTPNKGKSQSVKIGVLASSGDLVVVQDADLEYNPEDLTIFVNLFRQQPDLDVIYGNRFGKNNKVIYWHNYIGNRFLSLISSIFTYRHGIWTNDMEVCYKMVRGDIFRDIAQSIVSTTTFGLEPEVTAKLAQYRKSQNQKLRFTEIPISYEPRSIAEGKHMNAYRDGLFALKEIIMFNLFA